MCGDHGEFTEAGDGLEDDGLVEGLVEHEGEGSDGGTPYQGEQVAVVRARRDVSKDALFGGTTS